MTRSAQELIGDDLGDVAAGVLDEIAVRLGVAEVGAVFQRFGIVDYSVFIFMLLVCAVIGIYCALIKKETSAQEYLMGGRNMGTIPISLSLVASYVSGISLLGIPTEVYIYGIQYLYILGGALLMTIAFGSIFLPVFYNLNITSTYEYLDMRFDRNVRVMGSLLFIIGILVWLPIVVYMPALAFNQVTGINVHLITPVVCLICIFYTCVGGIKAVVYTDVIQTVIMFASMVLVAVKGSLDIGGFGTVFQRNWDSGRIEPPNLDLDPLSRHTVWSLVIGGTFFWLQTAAVNQTMIQRYLALPTLKAAKRSVWLFFIGIFLLNLLCGYNGMLIYATYHDCDPLTTSLAKEKDQVLPLLVMDVLGNLPGLPGLFVAGIFSAALSSLSTGLNSMAAVFLEDFYKPFFTKQLTERQTDIFMKCVVVVIGVVCVFLVVVVEKLGAVLQLSMSVGSISNGPSIALFAMGMLLPWVNSKGALIGSGTGLLFMSWLCLGTQAVISSGDLLFPEKPVTTDGCNYHFSPKSATQQSLAADFSWTPNVTDVHNHTDEIFMLYRLSYLWYTLIGAIVSMVVGLAVSLASEPNDPRDVDPKLLSSIVRRYIRPRRYSNQPRDDIILAYAPQEMKPTAIGHNSHLLQSY